MPDVEIRVGDRPFMVSCQPGEESFLEAAAALLDAEAQALVSAMGRLPEAKMLLMAGLMLADKLAAREDELAVMRTRRGVPAPGDTTAAATPMPDATGLARLDEIATLVEALAARAEETRMPTTPETA